MESHDILVIPGTPPLGREVCRLGRAAGHDMTSLSAEGRPDIAEPWLAGVEWANVDSTPFSVPRDRIKKGASLVCLPGQYAPEAPAPPELTRLLDDASDKSAARIVYATTGRRSDDAEPTPSEELVLQRADEFTAAATVLQLPTIDPAADPVEGPDLTDPTDRGPATDTPAPDETGHCAEVPVGQAGMAVLRASVEPETTGLISCRAATRLGYAAMIQ
jgi:hypothetical protein